MSNITLTSIDYAQLIQYTAWRFHKTKLNKTQINKILFYVYGVFLAEKQGPLFTDDTPKAWPFGPVFPKVNRVIDINDIPQFSKEKQDAFSENKLALNIVIDAVNLMYNKPAYILTKWSHKAESPWYNTIYEYDKEGKLKEQHPWNTVIQNYIIQEYFSNNKNREI